MVLEYTAQQRDKFWICLLQSPLRRPDCLGAIAILSHARQYPAKQLQRTTIPETTRRQAQGVLEGQRGSHRACVWIHRAVGIDRDPPDSSRPRTLDGAFARPTQR